MAPRKVGSNRCKPAGRADYAGKSGRASTTRGDPAVHVLLEHAQRNGAAAEDDVVEVADVELRAERLLRAPAELANLQLAELVRQRLAGPRNVAIDLGLDLVERQGGARGHVVDGLLARPLHR